MTAAKPSGALSIQPSFAKKVLKANRKVGKTSKGVPDLISWATELFLLDLVKRVTHDGTTDLRSEEIARVIQSTPEYEFLLIILPQVQAAIAEEGLRPRGPPAS
jgi:hypothetical protein